jgi:3D (Asp-Asp-Asp) domain-containing protein
MTSEFTRAFTTLESFSTQEATETGTPATDVLLLQTSYRSVPVDPSVVPLAPVEIVSEHRTVVVVR